jgi:hypothetical protein
VAVLVVKEQPSEARALAPSPSSMLHSEMLHWQLPNFLTLRLFISKDD